MGPNLGTPTSRQQSLAPGESNSRYPSCRPGSICGAGMFGWGMAEIPAGFEDLLEQRLYGHLATVGGDGGAQSSPMWFDWDGERVRFTHTTKRAKFRNVQAEPRVAFSILTPPTRTGTWKCGAPSIRSTTTPPAPLFRNSPTCTRRRGRARAPATRPTGSSCICGPPSSSATASHAFDGHQLSLPKACASVGTIRVLTTKVSNRMPTPMMNPICTI